MIKFDPNDMSVNRSAGIEIKGKGDDTYEWHLLAPVINGVEVRTTKSGSECGSIVIKRYHLERFISWLQQASNQLKYEEERAIKYRRGD